MALCRKCGTWAGYRDYTTCEDCGWIGSDGEEYRVEHATERKEARAAALLEAIDMLNNVGDDDMKTEDWLDGFEAAIDAVRVMLGEEE